MFSTRSSLRLIAVLFCSLAFSSCHRDPDKMKRKYFEGADKYFRNSKYREARIMYLSALKFDAKYGPAYYGLARADLKLNDLQETVRALRRTVELLPDSPERDDARVKLADIFLLYLREGPFQREVFEQASSLAAEILKRAPNSFDAHRIAGAISLVRLQDLSGRLPKEAQKQMLRAIAELEMANRIQPDQPDVLIPLVRCLEVSSRGAEAEKMLREALGRNQHNLAAYRDLQSYYVGTKRLNDALDILELAIKNNPKVSSLLIDLAHYYQAMDKPEESVKVIDGIAARSAEFPDAFVVAGDFYVGIGRLQDAIRQYEKGAAAFPAEKLSYQTRIVSAYAAYHRLADAGRINDAILKDYPKNVDALVRRAAILFETGDVKRSITELEGALRIAPSNPEAHFNLGRALLASKQPESARYQFTQAMRWAPGNNAARLALAQIELDAGEYGKAVLGADEALANQPKDLKARLIRSMGLRGLKKFDQSRAELNAILAVSPKYTEAMYQLGDVEQSVGHAKAAEAHYRKAYETNPANPQGLLAIAQLAIAQEQPERALKVIQAEIRKSPERPDLHLALASTAQRLRRFEVATSELEWLANKVQPNSVQYAEVEARLAECSLLRKDLQSALRQIEVARKLQPDNPMVLHNLGLIYDSLGRRNEARQVYEASLRLNEDDGVVLNNLAYLIAESGGDLDQALTFAQRARQKMPNELGFIDTIGWIYFKKNLPDNALEVFENLVRKKPDEPTFHYHLALVLLQKGQTFRARQELKAALASHPSLDESGKIAERLAGMSTALGLESSSAKTIAQR
jgi:tetratricopeptide (TPR) repeat protein